jgi:hypothetical protein
MRNRKRPSTGLSLDSRSTVGEALPKPAPPPAASAAPGADARPPAGPVEWRKYEFRGEGIASPVELRVRPGTPVRDAVVEAIRPAGFFRALAGDRELDLARPLFEQATENAIVVVRKGFLRYNLTFQTRKKCFSVEVSGSQTVADVALKIGFASPLAMLFTYEEEKLDPTVPVGRLNIPADAVIRTQGPFKAQQGRLAVSMCEHQPAGMAENDSLPEARLSSAAIVAFPTATPKQFRFRVSNQVHVLPRKQWPLAVGIAKCLLRQALDLAPEGKKIALIVKHPITGCEFCPTDEQMLEEVAELDAPIEVVLWEDRWSLTEEQRLLAQCGGRDGVVRETLYMRDSRC